MKNSTKVKVGTAVAVTAATAAAAAGAYWLYGSAHAAKHRKMAKSWMLKARAEVMDAIEKIEDIDKAKFLMMAEKIARDFGKKAGASQTEVAHLTKELRGVWTHIQAVHGPAKKAAKKGGAKKKSKKAAKKGAGKKKRA